MILQRLGFCRIKRERTGMHWRLAHQKGRISSGVAPASGGSGDGEADPVVPRASLRHGVTLGPAHGVREGLERAVDGELRRGKIGCMSYTSLGGFSRTCSQGKGSSGENW
jgi:hypothetical protein